MPGFRGLRLLGALAAGGLLGSSWLLAQGLLGPCASFGLVALLAGEGERGALARFIVAFSYYACGSIPIASAVLGYWGADQVALGVAAWLGASLLLAAPWTLARGPCSALGALAATALPPLGVIGWLSPLNAAGVFFPGLSWIGLGLFGFGIAALYGPAHRPRIAPLAALGLLALTSNLLYRAPAPVQGWTGVDTSIMPARGDLFEAIRNNEELIRAGIAHGRGARVVVFPEAILDDWRPGTRQQFALAVPAGQLWLLGAETDSSDAVVAVTRGKAAVQPLTRAAGLLLGGDWLPGTWQTLRPAWWETVFTVEHERIWAALCVEQVQPWTWIEAMIERPDVVIALANGWWTQKPATKWLPTGAAALGIERASSRAWTRLLHRPLVWAVNR